MGASLVPEAPEYEECFAAFPAIAGGRTTSLNNRNVELYGCPNIFL